MGDVRTTRAGELPLTSKERRLKRRRLLTAIAISVVVVVIAGFVIPVNQRVIASGYVAAEHYAEVRSPAVGTVAKILAQSGARVKEGDVLVQLESAGEQATLEEASSQVQKAEAELSRRESEITERKRRLIEDITVAKLRLQNAVSRLVRTQELMAKGLVAGSALEDDKLKEDLARAEVQSLTNTDLTVFDKELMVLRRELQARREMVDHAEAVIRARDIRAPISGQVLRYEFAVGELVRPDTVLMEIFGGDRQILKLRVLERHAARVAVGNRYLAQLAPYRGWKRVWFAGEVQHLRNVIQSEAQSTYRVAYCSFDPQGRNVPPGTTAEAKIYCGKTCFWFFLFGLN